MNPSEAPPVLRPDVRRWQWAFGVTALASIVLLYVLWRFNPSQHGFYPRCALYTTTGILCPGCGGLRATHQLLNGHIAAAFANNALAVMFAPILAVAAGIHAGRVLLGKPMVHAAWNRWLPFAVIAGILAGFTLARNLPIARWFGW